MTEHGFKAVDDVSKVAEGTTVRVGKSDIIHRPEGRVTGELIENDYENGIIRVASGNGWQPFSPSDQEGCLKVQGADQHERVFVAE